jgi:hypothetical protein
MHHEPYRPDATEWEFPSSGPLSGANIALPWIMFARDREVFEGEFPQWRVERVRLHTPLRYLVSGGISMRSLAPGGAHGLFKGVEWLLSPFGGQLAMFASVKLERTAAR